MTHLDPYTELGVPRDVTADAVRKAYRRKAKKAHPDAGGTTEAFDRARRAMIVLTDPAKRKTFDDTGRVEEEKPDNDRADALQIIEAFIERRIAGFFQGQEADPRTFDMLQSFRVEMCEEMAKIKAAIVDGSCILVILKDVARRFKGSDLRKPIERGFENRIRRQEDQVASMRRAIAVRELALEIAATYSFRVG